MTKSDPVGDTAFSAYVQTHPGMDKETRKAIKQTCNSISVIFSKQLSKKLTVVTFVEACITYYKWLMKEGKLDTSWIGPNLVSSYTKIKKNPKDLIDRYGSDDEFIRFVLKASPDLFKQYEAKQLTIGGLLSVLPGSILDV